MCADDFLRLNMKGLNMKSPDEILGAVAAVPDERYMYLLIANSRVYVFKEKQGRAAAENYLRKYQNISDISFAEVRLPRGVVPDSRKARKYIKQHWREYIIDDPVFDK